MFIKIEKTPNPETLKFFIDKIISPLEPLEFNLDDNIHDIQILKYLFSIDGVKTILLGKDFISITKIEDKNWINLKSIIIDTIKGFFIKNRSVLLNNFKINLNKEEFFKEDDKDLVLAIKDLINTRVRPAVAEDGGDIVFKGFKEGVVYLHMKGACSGCPSSTVTLKNGIENLLRYFIPEVISVKELI